MMPILCRQSVISSTGATLTDSADLGVVPVEQILAFTRGADGATGSLIPLVCVAGDRAHKVRSWTEPGSASDAQISSPCGR